MSSLTMGLVELAAMRACSSLGEVMSGTRTMGTTVSAGSFRFFIAFSHASDNGSMQKYLASASSSANSRRHSG